MTTVPQNLTPTRTRPPEVLAPAGSREALAAALHSGADAVYFGLDEGFNARARAANFTLDALADVVRSIHRAGARAYLTLNTLVFEPELRRVAHVLERVAAAGVDALIVQDPAVAIIARAICPQLELHASTQMTIASPEAASFAADLGVTRVVVPRELSVDEIRRFAAATDLELEVFVHGALCVSWSGQCLTSETWSGRSANRGQCAQSCRLPYRLVLDDERRDLGDVKYLLSPKDLAGMRAVPALVDLGIHGLKIEGRQKGPAYVATATQGYRALVDAVARGDRDAAEAELPKHLASMALAYTRGFSDGFLAGSDHQTLVEGRFPKHRGVLLGRVVEVRGDDVRVEPFPDGRPWTGQLAVDGRREAPTACVSSPLEPMGARTDAAVGPPLPPIEPRPGMGVGFDAGDSEDTTEPGGPLFRVAKHGSGWWLGFGRPGPDLRRVLPGQRVWLSSDPDVQKRATRAVEAAPPQGRIPVRAVVSGRDGSALTVRATVVGNDVTVTTSEACQRAQARGLDEALLRDKAFAFGGTPFALAELDTTELAQDLFVPPSALKEMRRALVAALEGAVDRPHERAILVGVDLAALRSERLRAVAPWPNPARAELVALVRDVAQLEAVARAGVRHVELDWMELVGLKLAVKHARELGLHVGIATLRVQKPGEERFLDAVTALEPDAILVRHWAALEVLRGGSIPLHGDFSLNVTNSLTAAHVLARGVATLTFSHDLDEAQLLALLDHAPAERFTATIHHRIAAFHTEHCVYAHLLSNGRDWRSCGRPCEQHRIALEDDKGLEHPVLVDAGCRNTVFHADVLSTAALAPELVKRGVRRFRVEFTREDAKAVERVLGAYAALLDGRIEVDAALRTAGARPHVGVTGAAQEVRD